MILGRVRLLLAVSVALFAGCTTTDHDAVRCTNIPANGCELETGVNVCTDPTCAALYVCNPDGSWTLDHTCPGFVPPHDAGFDADASPPASSSSCIDAGLPPNASASGGPQCEDLLPPDCPLDAVLACTASNANPCVQTGCASLYVCESSGWVVWGECEDDGGLVLNGN